MPNLFYRTVRPALLAGVLAGMALLGRPAVAQIGGGLPEGITTAPTLSAQQVDALQAFVRDQVQGLTSGDMKKVQQARDALLTPLETGAVSVAFRLRMSEALAPTLADLAAKPNEHTAFNALRLAGVLATDAAVGTIRKGLTDQRPAVRYGAALAARLTIEAVADKRSPLPQGQIDALIGSVEDALRNETDPGVFGGLIAAMEAIDPNGPGRLRAMTSLAGITADRIAAAGAAPSPEWARAFVRALSAAQSMLIVQLQAGTPDAAFGKNLAILSGQALAFAARRMGDAERPMTETERQPLRDLVASAEVSLLFVDKSLQNRTHQDQAVIAAFDSGRINAYLAQINQWVGAQGFLTKAPYSAAAASFRLPKA